MIRYLVLASLLVSCADETVPSPVPSAESAASSGGDAGCEPVTFSCCRTDTQQPICKDGTLQCGEGYHTCEP